MKLKRLTAEDFNRLADGTRLKPVARQLAYEVLVDGMSPSFAAKNAGLTAQRVALAVNVIEKAYFEDTDARLGWVSIELELPESLALHLDALTRSLKASGDNGALERANALVLKAIAEAGALLK
jgi:hypothetical protein